LYREASRSNGNGGARASVGSLLPIKIKKPWNKKRLVIKRFAVPQPLPGKLKNGRQIPGTGWRKLLLKEYPPLRLPAGLYDHIPDRLPAKLYDHIPDPTKRSPALPAERRPVTTRSDRSAPLNAAPKKPEPKEPKERRARKQPVFVRLPDRKLSRRPPRSYLATDQ
jgi:hypothetical protein